MSDAVTESVVEQCSLDWLGGLGYQILSGLTIAPGESAAERSDYKQVFLFDRLQTKLEDLSPKIPLEGLQGALLPKLLSGELRLPAATAAATSSASARALASTAA